MRLVTASEYADLDRPGLEWVVPDYMPKPSLILLLGPPKVGKSYFALQVALQIAQGGQVLGQPARQGPVLYFQFDTSEAVWRKRFIDLRKAGVSLEGQMLMVHPENNLRSCNIMEPDTYKWWRTAIEMAQPSAIVIDVYREIHNMDENDSTAGKKVGDQLMSIVRGHPTLLIHHTPKIDLDVLDPDNVRPVNLARGSSYLAGKADAIWLLGKHRFWVESRFGESFHTEVVRNAANLWDFPLMGQGEKLAALCGEFPTKTHSQIADIALARYNTPKQSYYRWLESSPPCAVHAPIAASVASDVTG